MVIKVFVGLLVYFSVRLKIFIIQNQNHLILFTNNAKSYMITFGRQCPMFKWAMLNDLPQVNELSHLGAY